MDSQLKASTTKRKIWTFNFTVGEKMDLNGKEKTKGRAR